MKYLKLSSLLVALFFAVGCGSKSVEKDGNTTQKTTQVQQEEDQDLEGVKGQEPEETVASPGGVGLPEGGFMPDGAVSGGDGYGDNSNSGSSDPYVDSDGNVVGGDSDDSYANNGAEGSTDEVYAGDDSGVAGSVVSISSLTTIYFDFDRYDIRADMKDYVRANADFIKEKDIKAIVLQGNTDEFGGDEYNTALGLKRAISVRDALVLQGLPRNMFSTISYGMHKPVCREKTAECYAKNRRTDIVEK